MKLQVKIPISTPGPTATPFERIVSQIKSVAPHIVHVFRDGHGFMAQAANGNESRITGPAAWTEFFHLGHCKDADGNPIPFEGEINVPDKSDFGIAEPKAPDAAPAEPAAVEPAPAVPAQAEPPKAAAKPAAK